MLNLDTPHPLELELLGPSCNLVPFLDPHRTGAFYILGQ